MPYIGNTPALDYISYAVQNFTVTAGTTVYTLDYSVSNENDIRLVINNVIQRPGASYAYSATGTTLTLTSATLSTDTMYAVFIGRAVQTVTPPANINLQLADGTAAAPSLNFANDTNTGIFRPAADTIAFTEGGAESMRIDSSGNVGIGTTSPSAMLDISNSADVTQLRLARTVSGAGSLKIDAGGNLNINAIDAGTLFLTLNTERMRITSGGDVLVGTTTASGKLFSSTSSASQPALRGASTSASYADNIVAIDADRNTTNNTFYAISYYNNGAAAHKFRVADSGNVTNTNNSYGAISDIKLKENIVDATLKLEKINQVRIVNFNFINDNQKQIGVIAQELENIFPSMVEESPDKDKDGNDLGTTTKQVKYSVFVPILIKAIQELSAKVDVQQSKIDALEARLTTLENK